MKRIGMIHLLILIIGSLLCFAGSFWFGLQKTLAFARATLPPTAPVVAKTDTPVEPKEPGPQKYVMPRKVAEELDGWRHQLEEREKKMLERDADLLRRNNLISAEKEALARERDRLTDLQKEIEARLIQVSQAEITNSEQVAQLYSGMKPVEAAGIMRQLTDSQNARLLAIMKPSKSAKIIETWSRTFPDDRERLARISDEMGVIVKNEDQPKITAASQP